MCQNNERSQYILLNPLFYEDSVHYLFFVDIDGFSDTSYTWSPFVQGSGAIHLNYIHCTGSEYKLVDCSSNRNTWSHFADWSITCNNGIFLYLSTGCFMLCKKMFSIHV